MGAGAAAGAELEAALAEVVEHRHPLGVAHGVVDARAEIENAEPR